MRTKAELDFIDESIRGVLPPHLWYQITLTFNPWNKSHWIKKEYFDPIYGSSGKGEPKEHPLIHAFTTNYMFNEFIDDNYRRKMELLKVRNPKRYDVAGRGNWGITSGVIFENYVEMALNVKKIRANKELLIRRGLDFGYSEHPTGFVECAIDEENLEIFILSEVYETGMSNRTIANRLKYLGHQHEIIKADSAEPKSIASIKSKGVFRIKAAIKGNDSVNFGIDKLQDYTIYADPNITPNFCTEIENYIWNPDKPNQPMDEFNHLMDAFRYATEDIKGFVQTIDYSVVTPTKRAKPRTLKVKSAKKSKDKRLQRR